MIISSSFKSLRSILWKNSEPYRQKQRMNGKETLVEVNENWRENGLIYIEIICPFGKQTDF